MSSANAFQAARKDFNEWYRTTDDYRWEIEQRKAEREAEKAKRAERTAARRAEREAARRADQWAAVLLAASRAHLLAQSGTAMKGEPSGTTPESHDLSRGRDAK